MPFAAPITSRSNARVKALRASLGGKASRPGEVVGIEGEHLIVEALASGIALDMVYLREGSEAILRLPTHAPLQNSEICILGRDAFESAMHTNSPQGIAATMAIPATPILAMRANPGAFLFVEDLQDPGNLGTLIRTAEAFGVKQVMVTPGTVSAWNPKAMRASAGSIFRIPVIVSSVNEFAESMRWGGIKMSAAVVKSEGAISLDQANLHAPCVIMIGNEGNGLSASALGVANERIHVPCVTESLNAAIAGSILMYEAARQNAQLFEKRAL